MVGGASETLPQVRLGTQPPRVSSVACGFSPGVSQPRPTSKVGRGRVRPTCSSPSHDPALLQDGKASSAAGGGRPNRDPPPFPAGPWVCWPRCRGSSALPQFPQNVSDGTQSWVAPGTPTRAELRPLVPGRWWVRRLPGWASSREWWPQGEAGTAAGHPRVLGRSRRAG